MGKRGPAPGAKYTRRATIVGSITIVNNSELVAAQHFCDHLDALLTQLDRGEYPAFMLASPMREKLRLSAEAVHNSVIGGIERFYDKRFATGGE
ncbi:MAG: hypothetical protein H7Y38_19460 [Armatimonadetes bacterium]|nr:hypothetical protein [Armatimonadota bacterium]